MKVGDKYIINVQPNATRTILWIAPSERWVAVQTEDPDQAPLIFSREYLNKYYTKVEPKFEVGKTYCHNHNHATYTVVAADEVAAMVFSKRSPNGRCVIEHTHRPEFTEVTP